MNTGKVYTREELEEAANNKQGINTKQQEKVTQEGEKEGAASNSRQSKQDLMQQAGNKTLEDKAGDDVYVTPKIDKGKRVVSTVQSATPMSYLAAMTAKRVVQTHNGFSILQEHDQQEPVIRPYEVGGVTC